MIRPSQITSILLILLLWGCSKDPISVQENVPKEYDQDLRWTLPSGWTEVALTSTMQMAAFSIVDGEETLQCTITSFEGGGGSDLENLNRWLLQLGRPATDSQGLAIIRENLFLGTHAYLVFDLTRSLTDLAERAIAPPKDQANDKSFIAAILRENNRSWFFKLRGNLAAVRKGRAPFQDFLTSIRLQGEPDELQLPKPSATPHALPVAGGVKIARKGDIPPGAPPPPSGPPPLPPGGLPPPPSIPPEVLEKMRKTPPPNLPAALRKQLGSAKTPAWQVPAGWKTLPSTPMRRGNFTISGDGGKTAAVTVIRLPSNSGSLDANITRWAGQVGLTPEKLNEDQPPVQQIEISGAKANYVVLRGPEKSTAVAVVTQDGGTWFFKLNGNNVLVESQRIAFEGFLKTVKF
jgi:hypothetical protein